jgi:hypothetical protein
LDFRKIVLQSEAHPMKEDVLVVALQAFSIPTTGFTEMYLKKPGNYKKLNH